MRAVNFPTAEDLRATLEGADPEVWGTEALAGLEETAARLLSLDPTLAVALFRQWHGIEGGKEFEREARRLLAEEPARIDPRPIIKISESRLPHVLSEGERALLAAGANVYQINGRLVLMLRHNNVVDEDTTEEALDEDELRLLPLRRADGALIVADMEARPLRVLLAQAARWVTFVASQQKWKFVSPPMEIALHLLEQPEWRLRVLRGSIEAPTLRSSGSVLWRPGYDRREQLYFDAAGVTFPHVPDRPSRTDGVAALAMLKDVLKDFPFPPDEDGGGVASASRSVALSAMLTGVVRRTLETAPAHAVDAPQAGSGKTKLTEIAAALPTGRKPTMVSQGATPEEFAKRLFAVLRTGDQVVVIDNVDREIESDELCTALTSPSMQGRVLGESRMATVTTNALVMFSGNNMTFKGDITDRTVIARLEPGVEDPKARKFDRDPVTFALEHRPALVTACLTAMRAHSIAGFPGMKGLKASRFPAWDRMVRGALVWLGEPDPQNTAETLRTVDPERDDLLTLMRAWEDAIGVNVPMTAKAIIDRAYDAASDFSTEGSEEDLRDALLRVLPGPKQLTPRALGKYLTKIHNRIALGRVIRKVDSGGDRASAFRLDEV
ncbi:MAG: hypothetical protein EOP22_18005 [Hyphomicrobiales bacterium]|nr:MAG: hypothetical protein EOP22_18005 [Hyphomicrobiales bacterium]